MAALVDKDIASKRTTGCGCFFVLDRPFQKICESYSNHPFSGESCYFFREGKQPSCKGIRTFLGPFKTNPHPDFLGGGFKDFLFSPQTWGRFPIWLIFFKWIETTLKPPTSFPFLEFRQLNDLKKMTWQICWWNALSFFLIRGSLPKSTLPAFTS